jgi:chromate reductase
MSDKSKILAFAGSSRRESYNRKLVKIAAKLAESNDVDVTIVELGDLNMPIFNEDLEAEGTPVDAQRFKDLMISHTGFLISSPEYNSSISPLLKNAIDWASRPAKGEPGLVAFQGKIAALMSASPGALGGLRGLVHVRSILTNVGTIVIPDQVAVPEAFNAFTADGALKEDRQHKKIEMLVAKFVDMVKKLQN